MKIFKELEPQNQKRRAYSSPCGHGDRNYLFNEDRMKTLIAAVTLGLFSAVTIAQTAPAAPANKPAVDCKDAKNKDAAECKKK
ncbi:MAG: hypothetical protein RLZZ344_1324 [Pseudomonadota bacterium]|jgi:hypothetical protein